MRFMSGGDVPVSCRSAVKCPELQLTHRANSYSRRTPVVRCFIGPRVGNYEMKEHTAFSATESNVTD